MSKVPLKSTTVIQRLLAERRQYESWIARLESAADATPESVRTKVRADYAARLAAVTEELKSHAETARQAVGQHRELLRELQDKEIQASERLVEAELRHAVGEFDEAQWTRFHKDSLAELVSIREEIKGVEADIAQLEELDALVRGRPAPRAASPPRPVARPEAGSEATPGDELSFLKSVTDEAPDRPSSTIRRPTGAGAQFQPAAPVGPRRSVPANPPIVVPTEPAVVPQVGPDDLDENPETAKTLQCRECGSMNLPTEWYCEQCGSELAAL